ncbi:LysR substrate-binding domain-containing protein [Reinekea blandensis]|uniref:Transcriptional regulator n=1 Tax=Reinekea blandensis MED297 TaxID=314283 RepID=A4BET9_9GAMM|nr:LysR substrate-binding domain-containing protein [Reinekea blandensis]EAR09274.1 transcriptional regulator [Reinekea sp. MED297] [Reinekea blandensis MED297]
MKFTLRQLQVFQQVAEQQSVSDAAKALQMSQSAASMALSQLESQLEKPLFHREGRKMTLNHWGRWLRPHALALLGNCKTIEMGMQSLDLVSGSISLGASQTPAEFVVPELVAALDRDFSHLEIGLHVENTEGVIAGLLDYRYDLGLIEGHCDDERLSLAPLCDDELVIVAGADHPYAGKDTVTLSQLEVAQWILRERGAGTREIFDLSIHEHIPRLRVHREYDQVSVILALVRQGQYLTCLSTRAVAEGVARGELVMLRVPELIMKRNFQFIWRRQDVSSELRELVLSRARHLIQIG